MTVFAFFFSSNSIFSEIAYNEFTSAAEYFQKVNFLLIDCDLYPRVCTSFSIVGVPMFILFNKNRTIMYNGIRSKQNFIEFIESETNIVNRTHFRNHMVNLLPSMVERFVKNEEGCNVFLGGIDWCRYTIQIKKVIRTVSNIYADDNINFGYINCNNYSRNNFCKSIPEIGFGVNGSVTFVDMNSFFSVEDCVDKINEICHKNRNVDGSLKKFVGISQDDINNIIDFVDFVKKNKKSEAIEWINDKYPQKTYIKIIMKKIFENGQDILESILNSTKTFYNYGIVSRKVKDDLNIKLSVLEIFLKYFK